MFADRTDAGRQLAQRLNHLRGMDVVVLGLPRGGVPVAYEVARALDAPLDVIVVRKLGVPYQPELAMGAIGEDGVRVINSDVVRMAQVDAAQLAAVSEQETVELERRLERFRHRRPRVPLDGRIAVVVDDGIATGSTARAACQVARAHGARRVVLAVAVAPAGVPRAMRDVADEVVCVRTPHLFSSVGRWLRGLHAGLRRRMSTPCWTRRPPQAKRRPRTSRPNGTVDVDVVVPAGPIRLPGRLTVPNGAAGLVVFAHGSGSSRHSPRNRYVAEVLQRAGLGTLLLDLLVPAEEADRGNVFDVELLADRLLHTIGWLRAYPAAATLSVGLFGASTGSGCGAVGGCRTGRRRGGRGVPRWPARSGGGAAVPGGGADVVDRRRRR